MTNSKKAALKEQKRNTSINGLSESFLKKLDESISYTEISIFECITPEAKAAAEVERKKRMENK